MGCSCASMSLSDVLLCLTQKAHEGQAVSSSFLVSLPRLSPAPLRFLSLQHGIGNILRQAPFSGALNGYLASQDTYCSRPLPGASGSDMACLLAWRTPLGCVSYQFSAGCWVLQTVTWPFWQQQHSSCRAWSGWTCKMCRWAFARQHNIFDIALARLAPP